MANMKNAADEARTETQNAAGDIASRAKEAASTVAGKAQQMGTAAKEKADQAVSSAGSGMRSAGQAVRDRGFQEGYLGSATSAVAGTLDSTGRYLEEQGLGGMADDLTNTIRRYPVPAMLIGVGIGFLLARMTSSSRS